jgi:hypothetical protein
VLDVSNVLAAFSEEHVHRVTGLSIGRLRYWARTGFFKPSFVEDDPRFASAGSTPLRTWWRFAPLRCCE